MDLNEVKARFDANWPAKRKMSTREQYWREFKDCFQAMNLRPYTKRQLQSKGREILLEYDRRLAAHGRRQSKGLKGTSRRTIFAAIKKVWRRGVGLDWPCDPDDFPDAAVSPIYEGPPEEAVRQWWTAWTNETDPYLKGWFAVEFNNGLRGLNQQSHLLLRHLKRNEATQTLLGIVADGLDADFKTKSWVISPFPGFVGEAVRDHIQKLGITDGNAILFPWRDAKGNVKPNRMHTQDSIEKMREKFRAKWNLPKLTSRQARKFVKGMLCRVNVPQPYLGFWQGHASDAEDMTVTYGSRPWEESFETALRYLPGGPTSIFVKESAPREGIPPRLADLWAKFESDKMEMTDFMNAVVALKTRRKTETVDIVT